MAPLQRRCSREQAAIRDGRAACGPYRDFVRVRQVVLAALQQQDEPYVLVTGETGTGKAALLRDLKAELDRARYRILYFQEAQRLGAPGLVRVLARSLRAVAGKGRIEPGQVEDVLERWNLP